MRRCLVCGRKFPAPTRRGRPPETCSPSCTAIRRRKQREETRQRAVARGCPDNMHGTSTGATHYMCHCSKCRKWWREYQQNRRQALKEFDTTPHEGVT